MFAVKKLDHVSMITTDLDAGVATFEKLFGLRASMRGESTTEMIEAALLPIGDSDLEIMSPRGNPALDRFLAKRGPGLHHLALEVDDLDAALAHLKSLNIALVDDVAKTGARGHRIAFVHPKATGGVLVELVQAVNPTTSPSR